MHDYDFANTASTQARHVEHENLLQISWERKSSYEKN